jgi:hypothetical protein
VSDFPRVPTEAECERETERERMREEFEAEQAAMRWERDDDYNVWEENQIFLDNEGGEY